MMMQPWSCRVSTTSGNLLEYEIPSDRNTINLLEINCTSTGCLFSTGLPINSVYFCTSFISTRHHPISKTLSPRQHQSVLVDGFSPPAVPATSSHGWDSNLVSAVSHTMHQPPGTLYRHHCNNSLTLTHLNGSWKLFFLNETFPSLDYKLTGDREKLQMCWVTVTNRTGMS